MRKLFLLASAVALGAMLTPVPASAATVTLITTPLVSPLAFEDFEDANIDPFFTFTSTTGVLRYSAGWGVNHTGDWGLSTNNFPDPITVTFAAPITTAGMWFGNDDLCCSAGFTAYLDVFGAGNTWLGAVGVVANMDDINNQFIGFLSDTPVYYTTIRYGSGNDVGLYHAIDDVQAGNAVPDPGSSLLLLGTGLVALRAWRKRLL
jgi:hypothetical protein